MSGGRSRARIAVLAALVCTAVAAAAGCSLLLDFSPAKDGGPGDDAGGNDDGGPAVNCDVGEPNDTYQTARVLEDSVDAAVCGDGPDFWGFETNGAQDANILLTFGAGEANDLELQLVRTSGEMAGEIVTI